MSEPMRDERLAAMAAACTMTSFAGHVYHDPNETLFDQIAEEDRKDSHLFTAADMRAQYSAGFRDGRASALPLDPKAPVIAGSS